MTEIQQQQWRFLVERARDEPDLMRVDPALIVAVAARLEALETAARSAHKLIDTLAHWDQMPAVTWADLHDEAEQLRETLEP